MSATNSVPSLCTLTLLCGWTSPQLVLNGGAACSLQVYLLWLGLVVLSMCLYCGFLGAHSLVCFVISLDRTLIICISYHWISWWDLDSRLNLTTDPRKWDTILFNVSTFCFMAKTPLWHIICSSFSFFHFDTHTLEALQHCKVE